ncbi:MAG TPA: DHHA1 domain-containing protein [Gemmataceae bacterium]|nr:DHHA1 domain-containing protein [Gemmataceae bacterium]
MDGYTAAWCSWRHFGDDAEYLPAQYGPPAPDVTGREVYLLDFSFKRPVLLEMAAKAASVVVVDHHKTAAAELKNIGRECNEKSLPIMTVIFDMAKSGARLAWEFFNPGKPAPWLVDYVEDRDLWSWTLPESRAINACLASWPKSFKEWSLLASDSTATTYFAEQGAAILRYQAQLVERAVANAVEQEIDGHKVLVTNATCLISEIGEQLAKGRPFSATFFIRSDDKRIWSLRSAPDGIDVSEVAKRHGGGGHRNAAGFEEDP